MLKTSFSFLLGKEGVEPNKKTAAISNEGNKRTAAISNENIRVKVGESYANQSEMSEEHENEQSCILSQPTNVLDDSLFTSRMLQKN